MADDVGAGGAKQPDASQTFLDRLPLDEQLKTETTQAAANTAAVDPEDPGTGGINPRTIRTKVQQAQAATTVAIGAGFQLTPAQIEKNIAEAADLVMRYRHLQEDIRIIAAVTPLAEDQTSKDQASEISRRGNLLLQRNNDQMNFLQDWISKLQGARENYMNQENVTTLEWHRLSQEPET